MYKTAFQILALLVLCSLTAVFSQLPNLANLPNLSDIMDQVGIEDDETRDKISECVSDEWQPAMQCQSQQNGIATCYHQARNGLIACLEGKGIGYLASYIPVTPPPNIV
jgi:hypothetical protein